jgi:hypothetical protein
MQKKKYVITEPEFRQLELIGLTSLPSFFLFLEMGCPRPLHQSMHTAVLLRNFKRLQVSSNGTVRTS